METKPDVSIILPSIRSDRMKGFFESLKQSCRKHKFELIVISPYQIPDCLIDEKNVKFVRDFGSPVRAHNIGYVLSEGDVITWLADDAILLPDEIDIHLGLLKEMGNDFKNVVVAKYYEGQKGSTDRSILHDDNYFSLYGCPIGASHLPNFWLFNIAFMRRKFVEALGGLDATQFEGTWAAHTDLGIRAQAAGAKVKMSGRALMVCDHMPDETGDHGPIHRAQGENDVPKLRLKYWQDNWANKLQLEINIMNWKYADAVWSRRFT